MNIYCVSTRNNKMHIVTSFVVFVENFIIQNEISLRFDLSLRK